MDLKLAKKVAIITGGAKGIGRAIIESFAQEGAYTVIVNRSVEKGLELEKKLNNQGQPSIFIQADLTNSDICKKVVTETISRFGRIDIIVNNAGINDGVSIESGLDKFIESLQKNLFHYYDMVHYALDELKKNQGCILNIGSKVCETGQGGTSGYAASKGAINALTREWALDLAPHKIRVNSIIPAEVMTPLYARWLSSRENPEQARKNIENMIPLEKRMTTSEEIANMTVFLASELSSHTTGQIIYVDGGYTHLDRACTN